MRDRSRMLVQVCESTADPHTKKREGDAMAELGLKTGTIVARNEEGEIKVPGGKIRVVPAWRFLLDLPESRA